MGVYVVGGEAGCYKLVSGHNYATTIDGAKYDNTLSRGAMTITTGVSELELEFGTSVSEVYLHIILHQDNVSANNYIDIKNAAGTETEYRIKTTATGTWEFYRYNGATYDLLGTTSAAMAVNELCAVDVHIVRDNTNGAVEIYKNTSQLLSFTGDTSTPNTMGLLRFIGLPGGTEIMSVSQVIVGDEPLLNWKLATLSPVADGSHSSWTGDYTHIDEFAYNANDFIEVNTLNALSTFVMSDVNGAYSTYNVKAVVVASRMSNDSGSVVNDGQFVVRTGGVDYVSSNIGVTKDGSEQSKQKIWALNPHTSNPWSISEVNSLEAGVKSV